jgi:molecular chaperone DnaJ
VVRNRRLDVKVPAGVHSGQKLRLQGEGGRGLRGGPSGDLILELEVGEDRFFRRDQNDNVFIEVPVTAPEALLGAKVEVPTVNGPVTLTIPAGTSSGQRLRLKGQGAPRRGGKGRGDQYVDIKIVVPARPTPAQKEAAEALAAAWPEDPRRDLPPGLSQ